MNDVIFNNLLLPRRHTLVIKNKDTVYNKRPGSFYIKYSST